MAMWKLIILLGLLPTAVAYAEVYKWVDEKGVHYSDRAQPGSEVIRIQNKAAPESAATGDEQKAAKDSALELEKASSVEAEGYQALTISAPANGSSVRSNEGLVTVSVVPSPSLITGDQFRFTLDGVNLPILSEPSVEFSNVNRGEHSLQVAIVDSNGKVRIQSDVIKFHLRQASK